MRLELLRAALVLCLGCAVLCFRAAPFPALSAAENVWRRRAAVAAGSRFGLTRTLLQQQLAATSKSKSGDSKLHVKADSKPTTSTRKSTKTLTSIAKKLPKLDTPIAPPSAAKKAPAKATAARIKKSSTKRTSTKLASRVDEPPKPEVAEPEEEKVISTISKEKGRLTETLTVSTTPLPTKPKGRSRGKNAVEEADSPEADDPALQPFAWYKEDRVARALDYVREITRDRYELIYMLAVLHHREILEGRMTDQFVQYNISDPKFPELYYNVTQGIRPFPWEGNPHVARRATAPPPPPPKHESMSDVFDDLEDFRTGVQQFISGGPVSEKFLNVTGLIDKRLLRHEYEKFQP